MKTLWKKWLSLLLVLTMTLSYVPSVFSEGNGEESLPDLTEQSADEMLPGEEPSSSDEDGVFPEADEALTDSELPPSEESPAAAPDGAEEAVPGTLDEAAEATDVDGMPEAPEEEAAEMMDEAKEADEDEDAEMPEEEDVPLNEVLAEIWLGKEFLGFGVKLEKVLAGYTRDGNTLRIFLAGTDSRITFYSDAILGDVPCSAGWSMTGEQILSLTEDPAEAELCLTVDEESGLRSVTAAEYALDPFGSYVVFAVASEGGFLDLEEENAFPCEVAGHIWIEAENDAESGSLRYVCAVCGEQKTEASVEKPAEGEIPTEDEAPVAGETVTEETAAAETETVSSAAANATAEAEYAEALAALFRDAAALLRLDRDYIMMEAGWHPETLEIVGLPDELADRVTVSWTVEDSEGHADETGAVTVDGNGTVTAEKKGTGYVTATVAYGDLSCRLRCRVDVIEGTVAETVTGASLEIKKVTSELYSTDYARVPVLLVVPQNLGSAVSAQSVSNPANDAAEKPKDKGVAIESAAFAEGSDAGTYFSIRVADDRTLELIPTQAAFDNAKKLSTCKGRIVLNGYGWTVTTDELTVTVKKTQPTIKASTVRFNSFNPGECVDLVFTGGTVVSAKEVSNSASKYVVFDGNKLTLTLKDSALDQKFSGKLTLSAEVEGWKDPRPVTVSVSGSKTAAKLTLKPSSLTLNPAAGDVATTEAAINMAQYEDSAISVSSILLGGKAYTAGDVIVEPDPTDGHRLNVSLKDGFDSSKAKSFTVNLAIDRGAGAPAPVGKLTVKTLASTAKDPSMTVKAAGAIHLTVPDSPVTLTVTPKNFSSAEYRDSKYEQVISSKESTEVSKELFVFSQDGNKVLITENPGKGLKDGTYRVTLTATVAGKELSASATFKVDSAAAAKSASLKAKGSLDVIRPESAVTVTPTLKNWYGHGELSPEDLVFYEGTGKNAAVIAPEKLPFGVTVTEDGASYTVTVKDAEKVNHKTAYSVGMKDETGTVRTATPLKLTVKMGTSKFTQSVKSITLSRNDRYAFEKVVVSAADAALSEIDRVELLANKVSAPFALTDLGDGVCEIHFAGDTVTVPEKTKSARLSLKVFLKGNNSTVANATLPVTVNIVKNDTVKPEAVPVEGTVISHHNFPDQSFREAVAQFDKDGDGALSEEETAAVIVIDCSEKGISSLLGIEKFTALQELNCSGNALTSLDLSANRALTTLNCSGNAALVTCRLPVTMTEIPANAFAGDTSLKNMDIPVSVVKIGESAFEGCAALESVTMGNQVATIGKAAFKNCSCLASMQCS